MSTVGRPGPATLAAVSTDGGIYPCYRLVFSDDPGCRLGDVEHGFTNEAAIARFAGFDPRAMRPEEGDCDTCASRDGCTHACPALGWATLSDAYLQFRCKFARPFECLRHRSRKPPGIGRQGIHPRIKIDRSIRIANFEQGGLGRWIFAL